MRISDWSSDVCSSDLVAPHAQEALVELLDDLLTHREHIAVPDRERVGIVDAEVARVFRLQAGADRQILEVTRRAQHAARENVLLDELALVPVFVEYIRADGHALTPGRAPRHYRLVQHPEAARPVLLADSLLHFNTTSTNESLDDA